MASAHRTSTSYSSSPSSTPLSATHRSDTSKKRKGRSRTVTSMVTGDQQIICAITESRGVSPVIGLAFVNLYTAEASMCQIPDNHIYERTLQKLQVYDPTEILISNTALNSKSRLCALLEAQLESRLVPLERKYWAENVGLEYLEQFAFKEEVEAIKVSIDGKYYAVCCLAAVLKYIETWLLVSFSPHSLRAKYEPSEGSMMVDRASLQTLELVQNSQNAKSKHSLLGLLNHTLTPMGQRRLNSSLLQPSTDRDLLEGRYEAVDELSTREDIFFGVRNGLNSLRSCSGDASAKSREALKGFVDAERVLTSHSQHCINNVIMLKQYVKSIHPIYEALGTAKSDLLQSIAVQCHPDHTQNVRRIIDETINEDIIYQSQPLDLRNQRTYAVKAGFNGLLDVARQTYKEATADAFQLITELGKDLNLALEPKYDPARHFFVRILRNELVDRSLPPIFINVFRRRNMIECQTLDLLKLNQKIADSHHEVIQMSDQNIQELLEKIREDVAPLFKISEAIAMLDMVASFAQVVTMQDYCRPELTNALAVKGGRHPIREKIDKEKYVPNDVYATSQSRFQIITGCNMSGKSNYIRAIALMATMAQIGCFVPASYASFPVSHSLFARVSTDDSTNDASTSTFAAEMRETAFILRNIDQRSLVIVDELGRGTSTRDGLCIAIAVCEALIESGALVWFVTHFRDLPYILAERAGVVNLHLSVDMSRTDVIKMFYRVTAGPCEESHYGLALAKVVGLPEQVLDVAEYVSQRLTKDMERYKERKTAKLAIALARRRRLVLGLREQLIQARCGNMNGSILVQWLKTLQDEFVRKMAAVEADLSAAEVANEAREPDDEDASEVITQILEQRVQTAGGDNSCQSLQPDRQNPAMSCHFDVAAVDGPLPAKSKRPFWEICVPVDHVANLDLCSSQMFQGATTHHENNPAEVSTASIPNQRHIRTPRVRTHLPSSHGSHHQEADLEGEEADWWCVRVDGSTDGQGRKQRSTSVGGNGAMHANSTNTESLFQYEMSGAIAVEEEME